jgi:hypothetical protein
MADIDVHTIALKIVNSFYTISPQLIPADRIANLPNLSLTKLSDVSLTKLSVHKTIDVEIRNFGTLLVKMAEIEGAIGRQSQSLSIVFDCAVITRSWLHFLDSSSRSSYIWSSLWPTTTLLYMSFQAQGRHPMYSKLIHGHRIRYTEGRLE